MKLIAKDKVFSLHALPDGFLYSYLIEELDGQIKVGYKMVSFSGGKISNVTKNIYMLTKFGSAYKSFIDKIKNSVTQQQDGFSAAQYIIEELEWRIEE